LFNGVTKCGKYNGLRVHCDFENKNIFSIFSRIPSPERLLISDGDKGPNREAFLRKW
jgi:hypothetical protein